MIGGGVINATASSYNFDKVWNGVTATVLEYYFSGMFIMSKQYVLKEIILLATSHILYLKGPNKVIPK